MATKLLQTLDAFLLEHNEKRDRDKTWSDNMIGNGKNWLGLQLMIVRDELGGTDHWTSFISREINLTNGRAKDRKVGTKMWKKAVKSACSAVVQKLSEEQYI